MLLGRFIKMFNYLKRKQKKVKQKTINISGLHFHVLTPTQKSEYKNSNRPDGCKECTEYPCYSNDSCITWYCSKCKHNQWRKNGR